MSNRGAFWVGLIAILVGIAVMAAEGKKASDEIKPSPSTSATHARR